MWCNRALSAGEPGRGNGGGAGGGQIERGGVADRELKKVAWPKDLYGQFFGGDSFLGNKPVDHFARYKSDHFTKTGSGQTQGSAEGNGRGHSFS